LCFAVCKVFFTKIPWRATARYPAFCALRVARRGAQRDPGSPAAWPAPIRPSASHFVDSKRPASAQLFEPNRAPPVRVTRPFARRSRLCALNPSEHTMRARVAWRSRTRRTGYAWDVRISMRHSCCRIRLQTFRCCYPQCQVNRSAAALSMVARPRKSSEGVCSTSHSRDRNAET